MAPAGRPGARSRRRAVERRAIRRCATAGALALAFVCACGAAAAPAAAAEPGALHAALPAAAAKVLSASAFSFDRTVLRSDVPVIVAFWAPWCVVCHEMEAPLAELAAKFGGRARVVRVNVDWSSRVARRYDVQSLPTVLVFAGGELVSRLTGGASEQDLEDLVAERLAPTVVATAAPVRIASAGGR